MQGKIAFEEHMAIPETVSKTRSFAGDSGRWDDFTRQILDVGARRLGNMDETGIEFALLSLNAPGIQGILDTAEAVEVARKANDAIAEAMARHPDRYGGMAALPMQDPDAASAELTRCIAELGFKGAIVNGFTQKDVPDSAIYYDIPEYRPFWATVSELDVPFYLHPRMQIPSRAQNYEGHPWLMSAPWGFAVETSIHSLRLCGSGIFDDYPNLRIVIGHLGEFIPHGLWRIDARMRFSRRDYRGTRPPGRVFPRPLRGHHQRLLQRSGLPQHAGRDGRRQGLLLRRLPLREHARCRELVRRHAGNHRPGPRQDRADQRH